MVAALCVAMVCVFSVQTVITTVDRVEHALDIDHDANAVAGAVQYCSVTMASCDIPNETSSHPVSHTHAGDAASSALVPAVFVSALVQFASAVHVAADAPQLAGQRQQTPDRPPKT
jgi:hypothetical protein